MILKSILWIAIIVVLILNSIVQYRNNKRFLKWKEEWKDYLEKENFFKNYGQ